MHQLIYLSQATAPFGDAQLQLLLARVRVTNARHGITGLLLYGNEQFLQVLEGERTTVHACYARIQQDARHRDVTVFIDQAVPDRTFPTWHMAFAPLPQQAFLELTDYLTHGKLQAPAITSLYTDAYLSDLLEFVRTFIK